MTMVYRMGKSGEGWGLWVLPNAAFTRDRKSIVALPGETIQDPEGPDRVNIHAHSIPGRKGYLILPTARRGTHFAHQ